MIVIQTKTPSTFNSCVLEMKEFPIFIPLSSLQFGLRHKRQHGADLYLPESFVIPGGDGDASEWGAWSSPSECSRTCGGGVAYQSRECLKVGQNGESNCEGGDKKYFSCNTQDCSEAMPDFRQQQCSNFDRTPFEGIQYNWVPYTKAPNPCELNCMPRGERFYYRHRSKVVDGTRCNDASVDVCVDGTCQVNKVLFFILLSILHISFLIFLQSISPSLNCV